MDSPLVAGDGASNEGPSRTAAAADADATADPAPPRHLHAHFDCFSGAAGDMLLAACLDASDDPEGLARHVTDCISKGMPELAGEFEIRLKRVLRGGRGSIAALHVTVWSRYHHAPAPVPGGRKAPSSSSSASDGDARSCDPGPPRGGKGNDDFPGIDGNYAHGHAHHEREHSRRSHSHDHDHSHDHGHSHHTGDVPSRPHECDPSSSSSSPPLPATAGPLRNLADIRRLLEDAPDRHIAPWVRDAAVRAFTELALAEAKTHGVPGNDPDAVHFHEVGAVDSIVDTVGTLVALHALNVRTVTCGPLPLGTGHVWCAHGWMPVPAPATLRLMAGMAVGPGPPGTVGGELVTPTGAALLRALAGPRRLRRPGEAGMDDVDDEEGGQSTSGSRRTGRPPHFTLRRVGIGAGTKDFHGHPNILRLMLGDEVME